MNNWMCLPIVRYLHKLLPNKVSFSQVKFAFHLHRDVCKNNTIQTQIEFNITDKRTRNNSRFSPTGLSVVIPRNSTYLFPNTNRSLFPIIELVSGKTHIPCAPHENEQYEIDDLSNIELTIFLNGWKWFFAFHCFHFTWWYIGKNRTKEEKDKIISMIVVIMWYDNAIGCTLGYSFREVLLTLITHTWQDSTVAYTISCL